MNFIVEGEELDPKEDVVQWAQCRRIVLHRDDVPYFYTTPSELRCLGQFLTILSGLALQFRRCPYPVCSATMLRHSLARSTALTGDSNGSTSAVCQKLNYVIKSRVWVLACCAIVVPLQIVS